MNNHLLNKAIGRAATRRRRGAIIIRYSIIALLTIIACANLTAMALVTASTSTTGSSALAATLNLSAEVISGGDQLRAGITLSNPTIAATSYDLSASPGDVVRMPASVTVRAGERGADFSITTRAVQGAQRVTITARPSGQSPIGEITARLSIMPGIVKSLALNQTSAVGGTLGILVTGTVTLEFRAPAGGVQVNLQSTVSSGAGSALSLSPTVEVPGDATSATFRITTAPVAVTRQATISATLGGVTKTANLTVEPYCVTNLTVSVLGNGQGPFVSTGSLMLNAPAPYLSDNMVTLYSSNQEILRFGIPGDSKGSLSIPFNVNEQGPKEFRVTVAPVSTQTVVTITARMNLSECFATRQITVRP